MSRVKTAREEWVEAFIAASLELCPQMGYGDDIFETAYEMYEKHSKESPAEVAKPKYSDPRTEYILGVNTPAWMVPGADVPPGWRYEGGAWRND